ncbi:MAG: RNA polymerase factor sigma-54 [bacterium]|nr:RNA polymerase factor sigma-54 [bacterium]
MKLGQKIQPNLQHKPKMAYALPQKQLQNLELLMCPLNELIDRVKEIIKEYPLLELEENSENKDEETEESEETIEHLSAEASEKKEEGNQQLIEGDKKDENDERLALPEDSNDPYDSSYNKGLSPDEAAEKPALSFTLQGLLLSQARLKFVEERLLEISECIIYELNKDGFFTSSTKKIAEKLNADEATVLSVLEEIQKFDPVGNGSRDTRECLLLQLRLREDVSKIAVGIIEKHFDDFVHSKYEKILQSMNIPQNELDDAINQIKQCNLKPGFGMGGEIRYALPDVTLKKIDINGQLAWRAHQERTLKLRLLNRYQKMLSDEENIDEETKAYLLKSKEKAKSFNEGIKQRHETINKIAEIVTNSITGWLDNKTVAPFNLKEKEVANTIGMDRTTVSKAIRDKLIQTPHGVFKLEKFFFKPKTEGSAKERIKGIDEIVAGEDKKNPFTDDQIKSMLEEKGLPTARRTVAKYRSINNLPVHERREKD